MATANEFISSTQIGMFALGLGSAQLAAPQAVAGVAGIQQSNDLVMRALGARETASGVAIMAQPANPAWLWARVAGDAIDIALLVAALRNERNERSRVMASLGFVGVVTLLDVLCAQRLTTGSKQRKKNARGET